MSGLYGIVPALITPLTEHGRLDVDALERLIEYQIEGGVHGLFAAGFTGEGAAMPFEMLYELARHTMRIVRGRVPVCVDVLETGAQRTVESALKLSNLGVPFLSTTAPFSPPAPTQGDILRHFEWVTRHTEADWMVYGNAGLLGDIAPETFHQLAQMPRIVAIKDTRPDYEGHLKNLLATRGDPVDLLCGGEYLIGPGLLAGAKGNISGAANLFPRVFVSLYEAARHGDVDQVNARARDIALLHGMTGGIGACWLSSFKYALERLGLIKRHCLAPCREVDLAARRNIDLLLERFRTA